MIPFTAQKLIEDLKRGKQKPYYLVHGNEPFQASEIRKKFKKVFLKGDTEGTYEFEQFDGNGLDVQALLSSLQMLPGLFSSDNCRLVVCDRFEKISASNLEKLKPYFNDPSPTTCFLLIATKVDKRKFWYKKIKDKGQLLEVKEPYEREWPKWQSFFEKKSGKKIELEAWPMLLVSANHSLSMLWSELQKLSTYVGKRKEITASDVSLFMGASSSENIFSFAESVVEGDRFSTIQQYHQLLYSGENEIKLLAILVRQFRLCLEYLQLKEKGVHDSRKIASQIGMSPYFVPKIARQANGHSISELKSTMALLSECDYRMKTGVGSLFDNFIIPHFARNF